MLGMEWPDGEDMHARMGIATVRIKTRNMLARLEGCEWNGKNAMARLFGRVCNGRNAGVGLQRATLQ